MGKSWGNKAKTFATLLVVGFSMLNQIGLVRQSNTDKAKGSTNSNSHGNGNNINNNTAVPVRIEDPRPWLVVHVGPPKTGTTTIQRSLHNKEIMKLMVVEDNIYYVGQKVGAKGGREERLPNNTTLTMFSMKDMVRTVAPAFGKEMEKHRAAGHNVVLSSEHYTSTFPHVLKKIESHLDRTFGLGSKQKHRSKLSKNLTNAVQRGSITSSNSEDFFGFRVKIVLAYRHFFQWVPSIHFQGYLKYRYTDKAPSLIEFIEGFVGKNESTYSERIAKQYKGLSGSLAAYKRWSSLPPFYDRIDVFDLHQQQYTSDATSEKTSSDSLFANFVCQSLPSASKTCEFLIDDQKKDSEHNKAERTSASRGSIMMPVDRYRVMDEATRRGIFFHPYDWTKETRKLNSSRRKRTNRKIDKWYDDSGGNQNLIPKRCPGETTLQKFREKSLDYLWEMASLVRQHSLSRQSKLGIVNGGEDPKARHGLDYNNYRNYDEDMFRSSTPRNNLLLSREYSSDEDFSKESSWWKEIQVQHDTDFDKYVAKEKFCEVDITKLFENEEFVRRVFSRENDQEPDTDTDTDDEQETDDEEERRNR